MDEFEELAEKEYEEVMTYYEDGQWYRMADGRVSWRWPETEGLMR